MTGTFRFPLPFASKKILILEGLHTLYTPTLRSLMDFSVFVDPDREVNNAWKRQRDTGQRGYLSAEVSDEIARREADYTAYIEPQRCFADAIIRIGYLKDGPELGRRKTFIQSRFSRTR